MPAYTIEHVRQDGGEHLVVTLLESARGAFLGQIGELDALAAEARPRRVLVDESRLRVGLVGPADMRLIAERWRTASALRTARIAVFAPAPIVYGLNRMFQALAGGEAERRVALFRGRADAVAWLLGPG